MIQVTPHMRILVAVEPADFRRGIDGLARLCREVFHRDPFSGWVFVFRNRRAKAIKILVYDGQGFWLCQTVAEFMASGGQLPVEKEVIRIKELIARFWVWAQGYYVKSNGTPTQELENLRQALRPLKELYADTPVASFGSRALTAVRQKVIEYGWCRSNINKYIGRLKTVFRWGTEQELVSGSQRRAITATITAPSVGTVQANSPGVFGRYPDDPNVSLAALSAGITGFPDFPALARNNSPNEPYY